MGWLAHQAPGRLRRETNGCCLKGAGKTPERPQVLLVEDDENDRTFFEIAIRHTGCPLLLQSVPNGKAAIEYLQGKGKFRNRTKFPLPKLIILDLDMPALNGFDFLAWRNTNSFASLPVIVLEGSGSPSHHQKAKDLGALFAFTKPTDFDDLYSLVRKISGLLNGAAPQASPQPAAPNLIEPSRAVS